MRVRNRVVVPAHQTHFPLEEHNLVGDRYVRYLEARARGGAGLIVAEAAAVHPSAGREGLLDLYRPEIVPGLRRLGEAVHGHGAKLFAQLSHMGNQDPGTSVLDDWHPVVAPSALPSTVYGRVAQALEPDEIADIVAGYGQAAAHAQAAGLDGAEISAVHGYLMTQFLSPFTNRRTDGYGGDVAHRCRFAIEAATEIRRRTGADFALGIRLSFDEHVGEAGLTPATSEEIVRILDATGLFDYFSLSTGNYHTLHQWVPSMTGARDGHLASDAARAKAAIDGRVPVVVAAAIRTLERAAEIVRKGQADLVAMARAHIADPDLVAKARAGRGREIRRCVGANQGCLRRLFEHGMITCTVNPAAGRERTLGAAPADVAARRVLVVGGGPAGMALADTAAAAGHAVTLLEREDALGGQLRLAGRLPNRGNWLELAEDMAAALERRGVDVRLGVEATPAAVRDADAAFLATGAGFDRSGYSISTPGRDSIPGAASDHVLDPAQAIADPERCGDRVVIVDDNGDHLPLGLALLLARTGRDVAVVSRQLFAGSGLVATGDLGWVFPELRAARVSVSSQEIATRIAPGAVEVESVWGGGARTLPADSVVLSMLRVADDALHRELAAAGVAATRIGDCLAPREVDDAIYEGVAHGRRIGTERENPRPQRGVFPMTTQRGNEETAER